MAAFPHSQPSTFRSLTADKPASPAEAQAAAAAVAKCEELAAVADEVQWALPGGEGVNLGMQWWECVAFYAIFMLYLWHESAAGEHDGGLRLVGSGPPSRGVAQ